MSGVSLPVTRPTGRALVVASVACRAQPLAAMQGLGFACGEAEDPYGAMAELARRPLVYRALILSLNSIYREELQLIPTIKRRFPHVDIWLTQTDGRQSALADAMRMGADGLLGEDGLHRIALTHSAPETPIPLRGNATATTIAGTAQSQNPAPAASSHLEEPESELAIGEPVLTADELRALLQEQPSLEED